MANIAAMSLAPIPVAAPEPSVPSDMPDEGPVDILAVPVQHYPPSWFDRLKVWVDRLPGPAWLFYLVGALALYMLRTILQWTDGTHPPGTFDASLVFTSAWPWYGLGAMHYLDHAAGRALDGLHSILSGSEERQDELRYRLTTMPARPALAAGLGALLLALIAFLVTSFNETLITDLEHHVSKAYGAGTSPAVLVITLVAMWFVGGLFFYHTVRQMRLIRTISTLHIDVAAAHLTPIYRLSRVTAATAAACSGGIALAIVTFTIPQVLSDPVALLIAAGIILLASVTFVWPLLGIHAVLEAEKARLHLDAQQRMKQALLELKRRQDNTDYEGVGAMNNALDALLKQQAVVDKIATWPWRTGTVGGLATAIFLPLVIWLITRILAQLIP